ncbi:DMT family transporter [Terriglobus aquaticus]|uniref:DMT family transporter n=1 Tax=Terriglobus aquaticus TaxID=940139 RepID=A0ABW9KG79_9BACT|nr:EamA family transporter [Terriglobus aquaticus]
MPQLSSKRPAQAAIVAAFLCVYIFWGSTFVAIRYAVQYLTPGFVSGFRYWIAAAIILLYRVARGQSIRIDRREALRLLILGLFLLTGNNVLLGCAEKYITAGYASLLTASVPILIALFETFIPGGEPLNRVGWAGTVLGMGGLTLLLAPVLRNGLVLHGHGTAADSALALGTGILIAAIFTWVAGSLIGGRYSSRVDPVLGAAWQMAMGGTVNVLIGTALGGWHTAHWTPGVFNAIAWLSIAGSLIGYSCYIFLLENVPVAKVATYAYVNPIVAVILSAVFLHESLHGQQWIAMAIILVAVAIVTASKSKHAPSRTLTEEQPEAA